MKIEVFGGNPFKIVETKELEHGVSKSHYAPSIAGDSQ